MKNEKTFRIGLAMAGAVSAGAYTAGVMDYLLEALENWQRAKELGIPGVPKHQVVIEVLSGASAGGMTAVLTAAAIQRKFPHINAHNYQTPEARENPLYHSWVNLAEDHHSDTMDQMLSTEDIIQSPSMNPGREVRSIFNSLFVEQIARRMIDSTTKDPSLKRPYFAADLEVLTTLTNLRGFDYQLVFTTASGKREDRMTMHKDLAHFQLNNSGVYRHDGKIPFHFESPEGLGKNLLVDAAVATGAFPAGLAPRLMTRDPRYINDNHLLKLTHGRALLVDPLTDYRAVCVDGGVINNEPYDLAETILMRRSSERRGHSHKTEDIDSQELRKSAFAFDSTVVMIDPFPTYEKKPDTGYFGLQALKFTAPQLFGAMRQQLMVKTDLLAKAYDDNDFTRFMIAPIRTKNGITQSNSLACSALDGFGGFFSKQFRIHDYLLGRRNCQRFIREFLCVPVTANNPVICYGYGDQREDNSLSLFLNNHGWLPVIPDIRISPDQKSLILPLEEKEFPYPSIQLKYLVNLEKKVQIRVGAILDNLSISTDPEISRPVLLSARKIGRQSWFTRKIVKPLLSFAMKLLYTFGKFIGKKLAARKFIDTVILDIDARGLLEKETKKTNH